MTRTHKNIMLVVFLFIPVLTLCAAVVMQQAVPSAQPVNIVYAGLLSFISLLILIVGWFIRSSIGRFEKVQEGQTKLLHRMDKRLVRVETKLGIESGDE
jgi:hypothetical protein